MKGMTAAEEQLLDPDLWCALEFPARREWLVEALTRELGALPGVTGLFVEVGPIGREYDLTALVETDVGRLRSALWSHTRAELFCDDSIHPANRAGFAPLHAVRETANRLRTRLAVPYQLESRGLTFVLHPEEGVARTWSAEHSTFRKRTAVVREDRVERAADLDVRDLLTHFYTGPSLRLVSNQGEAFLLQAGNEVEGPLITLCHGCGRWVEGSVSKCEGCGSAHLETVIAARPPRR